MTQPTQEQIKAEREEKLSSMLQVLQNMLGKGASETRMKAHLSTLYYDGLLDSGAWSEGYDAGFLDKDEVGQYMAQREATARRKALEEAAAIYDTNAQGCRDQITKRDKADLTIHSLKKAETDYMEIAEEIRNLIDKGE